MANNRIDRISELYGRALAEAIRQVKDPRVSGAFVSVTHCEVTNDLRYAKAYISVLGADDQAKEVMKGLKSAAGWLPARSDTRSSCATHPSWCSRSTTRSRAAHTSMTSSISSRVRARWAHRKAGKRNDRYGL